MPFELDGARAYDPTVRSLSTLQPMSYLLEPQLRLQPSPEHDTRTIVFVNRRAVCIILYALDAAGRRVQHATIAPGQQSVQQTALSQPWIAVERTQFIDKPLSIWLAGEKDGVAYIE